MMLIRWSSSVSLSICSSEIDFKVRRCEKCALRKSSHASFPTPLRKATSGHTAAASRPNGTSGDARRLRGGMIRHSQMPRHGHGQGSCDVPLWPGGLELNEAFWGPNHIPLALNVGTLHQKQLKAGHSSDTISTLSALKCNQVAERTVKKEGSRRERKRELFAP